MRWKERNLVGYPAQRRALWDWVDEWTGHPALVGFAARVIKLKNINARDDVALARSAQSFTQQRVKYFKEQPERWQSPLRTIVWGIGDCDDMATLIASWIRSFRIPVRLKFLRMSIPAGTTVREPGGTMRKLQKPKKVSHVFAQALLRGKWTSLDAVKPYPLGFDPETLCKQRGVTYTVETIGDDGEHA